MSTPSGCPQLSISVVIAAYQQAGFVSEAVRSAFQQTCLALEVVVIDDGSGLTEPPGRRLMPEQGQ